MKHLPLCCKIKTFCFFIGTRWGPEDIPRLDPTLKQTAAVVGREKSGRLVGRITLLLRSVQDSANYTCVASSTINTIRASTEVRIKAIPKVSEPISSTTSLWRRDNYFAVGAEVLAFDSWVGQVRHSVANGAPLCGLSLSREPQLVTRFRVILEYNEDLVFDFESLIFRKIKR